MKKCKYCQSEIDQKAKICPHCRKKQSNTGVILTIVISLTIVVFVCIRLFMNYLYDSISSSTDEFLFKSNISLFSTDYFLNCKELESIANDIESYWYDSIFEDKYNGDINEATNQALEDNKTKIQNQKDSYDSMESSYKEIINSKCKSDYCDEIKDNVKNAYKTYKKFYNLAIYPSGSYYEYVENFKKIDSEASDYYDELSDLLDLFSSQ